MTQNLGQTNRMMRAILGTAMISMGLRRKSWWGILGLYPLVTGLMGYCPVTAAARRSAPYLEGYDEMEMVDENEMTDEGLPGEEYPSTINGETPASPSATRSHFEGAVPGGPNLDVAS